MSLCIARVTEMDDRWRHQRWSGWRSGKVRTRCDKERDEEQPVIRRRCRKMMWEDEEQEDDGEYDDASKKEKCFQEEIKDIVFYEANFAQVHTMPFSDKSPWIRKMKIAITNVGLILGHSFSKCSFPFPIARLILLTFKFGLLY